MRIQQLLYLEQIVKKGSINEAAKELYLTQPSLSNAIKELEEEMGIQILLRQRNGVSLTEEGREFMMYAKQILDQINLMEEKYKSNSPRKQLFSVSAQHYAFVVHAFVKLVKETGGQEYQFTLRETETQNILDDLTSFKSELGVLYLNDFNKKVLTKLFQDSILEFHPLFECGVYAYLFKGHPLAKEPKLALEDLVEYPCLSFEQGEYNSFYFAEEVLSTYQYKRFIKANDRATMLNLMVGLNGYTLCSGIICEELNGSDYCAVKLKTNETMQIGYIQKKGSTLSRIGQVYLEEVMKFKDSVMH